MGNFFQSGTAFSAKAFHHRVCVFVNVFVDVVVLVLVDVDGI
jgi:hypothetical protein